MIYDKGHMVTNLGMIADQDVVSDCVLKPDSKDPFSDFACMLRHVQINEGLQQGICYVSPLPASSITTYSHFAPSTANSTCDDVKLCSYLQQTNRCMILPVHKIALSGLSTHCPRLYIKPLDMLHARHFLVVPATTDCY